MSQFHHLQLMQNFLLLGIICLVFLSKRKSNSSVKSSAFSLSFRLYSTGFTKSFNENFEMNFESKKFLSLKIFKMTWF